MDPKPPPKGIPTTWQVWWSSGANPALVPEQLIMLIIPNFQYGIISPLKLQDWLYKDYFERCNFLASSNTSCLQHKNLPAVKRLGLYLNQPWCSVTSRDCLWELHCLETPSSSPCVSFKVQLGVWALNHRFQLQWSLLKSVDRHFHLHRDWGMH